jgi:hypothetical protein
MKRIVKLDGQGLTGDEEDLSDKCFAIYDTVRDSFDTVAGDQVFDTAKELEQCFDIESGLAAHRGEDRLVEHLTELKKRCVGLARSAGY